MVAFWGYEVTETKAAVVDVPEGFVLNVVNATSTGDAQVALGLETQQLDGKSFKGVVAHLGAKQPLQVKLDLVFGHKVKFYLAKGSGAVNLTGYFQAGPVIEIEERSTVSETSKKSKKRGREEQKSWDEISPSSSDSDEKVKESKPMTTTPVKKEEQKKPKQTETPANTSSNPTNTEGTSQKKKRKKNKNKKHAASGEAK